MHQEVNNTESWCVLRTAGRTTLKLAETLAQDGFEVWTPTEQRTIRRRNLKRKIQLPILPTYVFARAKHLIELLEMEKMAVKPRRGSGWGRPAHASFTVFRHGDAIPHISDRHLNGLRQIEIKRAPKRKADREFPNGVTVKVLAQGGVFAGMVGTVERSSKGVTRIRMIAGHKIVDIDTCLLEQPDIGLGVPSSGEVARKAA